MDTLSLDQLKAFVASADCGSFSAAGRQLGKVQSVISTQIQNLELDLGIELFDRSGKYPKLTSSAEVLLPIAKKTIALAHRFKLTANAQHQDNGGQLVVACEEIIFPVGLKKLLANFALQFPYTQLHYTHGDGDDVTRKVAKGEIDFAFIVARESYPDEVTLTYMGQQKILTVVSPSHPLANGEKATHLTLSEHCQLLTASTATDPRWRLSLKIWTCDSMFQVLDLASEGVGWVNAPAGLSEQYMESGRLVALDTSEAAVNTWSLGVDMLYAPNLANGLVASWFGDQAKQLFKPTA